MEFKLPVEKIYWLKKRTEVLSDGDKLITVRIVKKNDLS